MSSNVASRRARLSRAAPEVVPAPARDNSYSRPRLSSRAAPEVLPTPTREYSSRFLARLSSRATPEVLAAPARDNSYSRPRLSSRAAPEVLPAPARDSSHSRPRLSSRSPASSANYLPPPPRVDKVALSAQRAASEGARDYRALQLEVGRIRDAMDRLETLAGISGARPSPTGSQVKCSFTSDRNGSAVPAATQRSTRGWSSKPALSQQVKRSFTSDHDGSAVPAATQRSTRGWSSKPALSSRFTSDYNGSAVPAATQQSTRGRSLKPAPKSILKPSASTRMASSPISACAGPVDLSGEGMCEASAEVYAAPWRTFPAQEWAKDKLPIERLDRSGLRQLREKSKLLADGKLRPRRVKFEEPLVTGCRIVSRWIEDLE